MPGNRNQQYSWKEEEDLMESSQELLTSGAAAVQVRRSQQQQQHRKDKRLRQLHESTQAARASTPASARADTPTAARKKPCVAGASRGESSGACLLIADASSHVTVECGAVAGTSQLSVVASNDGGADQPHLRSRWTDTGLVFSERACAALNVHLGITRVFLQPDGSSLRHARRARGDG